MGADKHPRRDQLIEQVKAIMPGANSDNKKAIVEWSVDKVCDNVSIYTNLAMADLPESLDSSIVGMCVQDIGSHGWLDDDPSRVQSVTEGDVSVTFKSLAELYAEIQSSSPITDNYLVLLNTFRVLQS